jgi:exonuclease III
MIKILFWNARGAGSGKFQSAIVDLIKINHVDILAICEPKVQFQKASKTMLSLGFTDHKIVEANGFSGGIWLFWNSTNLHVDFIDKNAQTITVKVTLPGGPSWMLSTLYASPTKTVRSMLWSYFDNLMRNHKLPWIFIGDFNELYSAADKNLGTLSGRFGGLKQWVDHHALIDLGFFGSCYTWSNNRIKERLDRAFCTCDWRLRLPEAFIRHLPKMKSDHCPILLQLHSNNSVDRSVIPFRFQAMWLTHKDFPDFVSSTWESTSGNFLDRSKNLSQAM